MMRTGIDIAKLSRFENLITDNAFLKRVFTQQEVAHINEHKTAQGKIERMAGKFCAKEAVSKALGVGIGDGINFADIEILPDELGKPRVKLYRKAQEILVGLLITQIEISISHDGDFAIANCVML